MIEIEEAEATYAKATEQIAKWEPHARTSSFAAQQVQLWRRIQRLNSWCLPGASAPEEEKDG